jgi:hypothetical protein
MVNVFGVDHSSFVITEAETDKIVDRENSRRNKTGGRLRFGGGVKRAAGQMVKRSNQLGGAKKLGVTEQAVSHEVETTGFKFDRSGNGRCRGHQQSNLVGLTSDNQGDKAVLIRVVDVGGGHGKGKKRGRGITRIRLEPCNGDIGA